MTSYERKGNDHYESKTEESSSSRDFFIGALIGGIVGAATAFFLAPKSGKEVRHNLNVQANSLKKRTGQIRNTAIEKGAVLAEAAKERTSTIGQAVSKQSSQLINKVRSGKGSEFPFETEDQVIKDYEVTSKTNEVDLQKMLEETKRAFDDTESQLNRL